MSFGKTS